MDLFYSSECDAYNTLTDKSIRIYKKNFYTIQNVLLEQTIQLLKRFTTFNLYNSLVLLKHPTRRS